MTKDNNLLGRFNLEGIPPAVKSVPVIEVTIDIDANNTLKVTATDKKTENSREMIIDSTKEENQDDLEGETYPVMAH